ncbi:hypothetical protein CY35_16G050800 [Sphagnum magellanicum]|nr:hypothetical protein CY35_16G050800 [Sphagnum magellanicum]
MGVVSLTATHKCGIATLMLLATIRLARHCLFPSASMASLSTRVSRGKQSLDIVTTITNTTTNSTQLHHIPNCWHRTFGSKGSLTQSF